MPAWFCAQRPVCQYSGVALRCLFSPFPACACRASRQSFRRAASSSCRARVALRRGARHDIGRGLAVPEVFAPRQLFYRVCRAEVCRVRRRKYSRWRREEGRSGASRRRPSRCREFYARWRGAAARQPTAVSQRFNERSPRAVHETRLPAQSPSRRVPRGRRNGASFALQRAPQCPLRRVLNATLRFNFRASR